MPKKDPESHTIETSCLLHKPKTHESVFAQFPFSNVVATELFTDPCSPIQSQP